MFKASGSLVEQRPVVRLLFAISTIQFKRTLRMQPPLGAGDTSSSESVERRLYSQATLNVLGLTTSRISTDVHRLSFACLNEIITRFILFYPHLSFAVFLSFLN